MGISEGVPRVTVIGAGQEHLDEGTGEFRARLARVPGAGSGPVVVDLGGVRSVDGAVLGDIAAASWRARKAGVPFGVICPAGPVRDMFAVTGADRFVTIAGDEDGLGFGRDEEPARPGPEREAGKPGTVTAGMEVRLSLGHGPLPAPEKEVRSAFAH